jgi:ribonuclease J
VKAGIELLDASRNGIVDARVLKERQQLAEDGVITLLAVISTDGVMAAPPRVNHARRGDHGRCPQAQPVGRARDHLGAGETVGSQLCRNSGGKAPDVDWVGVQREVEVGLQRRLRRELQVEPLIICLVQPAPAGTPAYKGRADAEPDSRPAPRGRGGRGAGDRHPRPERQERAPLPERQLARTVGASATASTASASRPLRPSHCGCSRWPPLCSSTPAVPRNLKLQGAPAAAARLPWADWLGLLSAS